MRSAAFVALGCCLFLISGCPGSERGGSTVDPNVVPTPENLDENREFVSPLSLQSPIYACARTVVVKDFVLHADVEIYVDNTLVVTHSDATWGGGQPIDVGFELEADQIVHARQIVDGQRSDPSNSVTVIDHTVDYPGGLPAPRISRTPLLECGRAIGIADAVPGATITAYAENPDGAGGFLPEVQIGQIADFGYLFCTALEEGARVRLEATLCEERASSGSKTVDPEPSSIPTPVLDPLPVDGAEIVVFWGPGGNGDDLLNGASLEIKDGSTRIGGQPTPGGGQQVLVNPPADASKTYAITQALCSPSPPGNVTPQPCSALEAPTIYPPLPGDTQVDLIDYYPGARILVFANGAEIGDSGPATIHLSQPIAEGDTITVVQRVGDCTSSTAYQVRVECDQGRTDCVGEWPAFRQSATREANQPHSTKLADPEQVRVLREGWSWQPSDEFPGTVLPRGFTSSPIVYRGRVYVGGSNGRLYALDAATGNFLWVYPPASDPNDLVSVYESNPSSFGLAASPTIGVVRGEVEVVIFGAPDQSIGAGHGSGRLFSIDAATGALRGTSGELAVLSSVGTAPSRNEYGELHEQFGYSSPLVSNGNVYIGIADHGDNPIQKGKIKAVDIASLAPPSGFTFESAGGPWDSPNGRGGGVWNSPAAGRLGGIFFTTGNTRIGPQTAIPSPNHGLSLIRVSEATGGMAWKLQPVPYSLDCDPDWAAGAIVTPHGSGEMVVSTMKDGWAYGVRANASTAGTHVPAQWQFPPTGTYDPANGEYFHGSDGGSCSNSDHGDTRYLVAGAAWRGTYITMTGGDQVTEDVRVGFGRLHSLSVGSGAVRWMADIDGVSALAAYQLGPPTVTQGIVFVGTTQGRLVAIADPSVYPSALSRCSHSGFGIDDCESNGHTIVKDPIVLFSEPLGKGGLERNEPVIANDRIFLTTTAGRVVMLEP